ncbi:MAG TPA: Crp/Fnr family transcriptional regulator [Trichocoleus sp.]
MHSSKIRQRSNNLLLDSLPQVDFDLLHSRVEQVELQQGDILYRAKEPITEIYFPTTGFLSLVNSTPDGEIVEVGATGIEGFVGIPLFLGENTAPYQVEVQISGRALKLSTTAFIEVLDRSVALRERVAAFIYLKIAQLNQSAVCNRFHRVEERLCRWLLVAQDRMRTPELALTREVLAHMVGSRRPAISLVTNVLQAEGLILAERGKITILDRKGMETCACECYHIMREEVDRYLEKINRL